MSGGAEFSIEKVEGGAARLVLSGPYLISTIGAIDQDLARVEGEFAEIDIGGMTDIDTVGAW
ncbi:MAG TPA: ABC transporter permease, partial [Erythrobacter sp.]|nr:ABC transporter permease [Erythrobacter sp.]